MKRLLREPLVHFLLLGAAIFAVSQWTAGRAATKPGQIVVTQGHIDSLATGFGRTWQRPPTTAELEGLVRDYIREEIYAREAIAIGLDKDDTIIRRRLRQKLEFVSEDVAAQAEPTDEQLGEYLKEHPDAFRTERRFTFSQVYLNPRRHGENLGGDTAQMLAQLRQAGNTVDVSTLGDSLLLDYQFDALPAGEVAKLFGAKFTLELGELPAGQWQGPIESGYGVHLVRISERTEGRMPALEQVREAVRREWANARRVEANEKFYQALLARYTVTIEAQHPAENTDKKQLANARR